MVNQPLGAVGAQRLLVGHREIDEAAARPEAGVGQMAGGDRHRGGQVEHVDRAPAPHHAVDELAAERVAVPAVGVDGDDVGVAHQQQRGRVGVATLDAGDEARPPRLGLVPLEVEPGALEVGRQQVDAARFAARRERAVVHARVPDQLLKEVGDLGSGIVDAARGAHRLQRKRVSAEPGQAARLAEVDGRHGLTAG